MQNALCEHPQQVALVTEQQGSKQGPILLILHHQLSYRMNKQQKTSNHTMGLGSIYSIPKHVAILCQKRVAM